MYGMIHRGVRQMVLDTKGNQAWNAVETTAGIGQSQLISAEVYDDAITMRLLAAAAECLEMDPVALASDFGRYWIRFAERGSFGVILQFTGDDLVSFIANLDRLHRTVRGVMPKARTPGFAVLESEPGRLVVRYRSTREGLEPFVEGLLSGLLERFALSGSVRLIAAAGPTADFEILHAPRQLDLGMEEQP